MSASISTHVLDTALGRPVEGVRVELFRGEVLVAAGVTDADGRIGELASVLPPAAYRIIFHPASEFFTRVELEIALGEGHFHVPLLVSPYSCTTYRGS
ncbi:MAG: hydroxyisourate hydrolase [Gaiellaceae bacterium]